MDYKRIRFPSGNFYHFGVSNDAVDIDDKQIEDWINETIQSVKKQLDNGIESPYAFRASGNTIVICFFSQECEDDIWDENNMYDVIVCKNYYQADIDIADLTQNTKTDYATITLQDLEELSRLKGTPNLKIGKFNVYVDEDEE